MQILLVVECFGGYEPHQGSEEHLMFILGESYLSCFYVFVLAESYDRSRTKSWFAFRKPKYYISMLKKSSFFWSPLWQGLKLVTYTVGLRNDCFGVLFRFV